MKDKAKTAFYAVLAIGVLSCIIVYMYVYQPYLAKTEALKTTNATLSERVDKLKTFYSQMADNENKITEMTADINSQLDEFPPDVKEEDIIYLALRSWDEDILVGYSSIVITPREDLALIPAEVVQPAGIEGLDGDISIIKRDVTYTNITTYDQMKELIKLINANPEQLTIKSVAYALSEGDTAGLGILEGSIDVTFYAVLGTGKEYVPREFADFPTGLNNLFGGFENLFGNAETE